jgi:uncharacterized protein (DUF433 family)
MSKKIGIGILVALVVAAVGVGAVLAQEPTPAGETPPVDESPVEADGPRDGRGKRGPMGGGLLEVVAEALGMTVDELREALADGQTVAELAGAQGVALEDVAAALAAVHAERLQRAVEDGRLTQEEAEEKLAEMKANILERLESGEFVGPGGPGGPGVPGSPRGGRGVRRGEPLDVVAEALGMTVDELREALADGQTIAELAGAQGVALEDITDAMMAAHAEWLQQAEENGRLTQEEAEEKLAEMKANILESLESGEFAGLGGPGGPGMPGGPRGGRFGAGASFEVLAPPVPKE